MGESSRGVYDIDPIAEMQRLENEFNAMEERLRDDEYDYDSNDDYDGNMILELPPYKNKILK